MSYGDYIARGKRTLKYTETTTGSEQQLQPEVSSIARSMGARTDEYWEGIRKLVEETKWDELVSLINRDSACTISGESTT